MSAMSAQKSRASSTAPSSGVPAAVALRAKKMGVPALSLMCMDAKANGRDFMPILTSYLEGFAESESQLVPVRVVSKALREHLPRPVRLDKNHTNLLLAVIDPRRRGLISVLALTKAMKQYDLQPNMGLVPFPPDHAKSKPGAKLMAKRHSAYGPQEFKHSLPGLNPWEFMQPPDPAHVSRLSSTRASYKDTQGHYHAPRAGTPAGSLRPVSPGGAGVPQAWPESPEPGSSPVRPRSVHFGGTMPSRQELASAQPMADDGQGWLAPQGSLVDGDSVLLRAGQSALDAFNIQDAPDLAASLPHISVTTQLEMPSAILARASRQGRPHTAESTNSGMQLANRPEHAVEGESDDEDLHVPRLHNSTPATLVAKGMLKLAPTAKRRQAGRGPQLGVHVPFWGLDRVGQGHRATAAAAAERRRGVTAEARDPHSVHGAASRADSAIDARASTADLRLTQSMGALGLTTASTASGWETMTGNASMGTCMDDYWGNETRAGVQPEASKSGTGQLGLGSTTGLLPTQALSQAAGRDVGAGNSNIAGEAHGRALLFGKSRAEAFLAHLRTNVDTLGFQIRESLRSWTEIRAVEAKAREQESKRPQTAQSDDSEGLTARLSAPDVQHMSISKSRMAGWEPAGTAALVATIPDEPKPKHEWRHHFTSAARLASAQEGCRRLVAITDRFEVAMKQAAWQMWLEYLQKHQAREIRHWVSKARGVERMARLIVRMYERAVGPRFVVWKKHAWKRIRALRVGAAVNIQRVVRGHLARCSVQRMLATRAAITMQRVVRGRLARATHGPRILAARRERAAVAIQCAWRAWHAKQRSANLRLAKQQTKAATRLQALIRGRHGRRRASAQARVKAEIDDIQRMTRETRALVAERLAIEKAAQTDVQRAVAAANAKEAAERAAYEAAKAADVAARARREEAYEARDALAKAREAAAIRAAAEQRLHKVVTEKEEAEELARAKALRMLRQRKMIEVHFDSAVKIQRAWRAHLKLQLERVSKMVKLPAHATKLQAEVAVAEKRTMGVAHDLVDRVKLLKASIQSKLQRGATATLSPAQAQGLDGQAAGPQLINAGEMEQLLATVNVLNRRLLEERQANERAVAALQNQSVMAAKQVVSAMRLALEHPQTAAQQLAQLTDDSLNVRKYPSVMARELAKRSRRAEAGGKTLLRRRRQVEAWDYGHVAKVGSNTPAPRAWIKYFEPAADMFYFVHSETRERRLTRPAIAEGYFSSDSELSDDEQDLPSWLAVRKFAGQGDYKPDEVSISGEAAAAYSARWKAYICAECNGRIARRRCDDCAEIYCDECWRVLHRRGKRAFHTWKAVRPWNPIEKSAGVWREGTCSECHTALAQRRCRHCSDREFCPDCYELTHRTNMLMHKHRWVPVDRAADARRTATLLGLDLNSHAGHSDTQSLGMTGSIRAGSVDAGGAAEDVANWAQDWDGDSGYPYWYNTVTGESTWEAPAGWQDATGGYGDMQWDAQQDGVEQFNGQASQDDYGSVAGLDVTQSMEEVDIIAAGGGAAPATALATQPESATPSARIRRALASSDEEDGESGGMSTMGETTARGYQIEAPSHVVGGATEAAARAGPPRPTAEQLAKQQADDDMELASVASWVEFQDQETGRPYYYHIKSKTTTWHAPEGYQ